MEFLEGKKTLLAAAALLVFNVLGLILGKIEPVIAWNGILGALAVAGLRVSIK